MASTHNAIPAPTVSRTPPHHVDVAVRIDADLDLDGADALLCNLRDFPLRFFGANQSDRMGDRNAPAHCPAEQAMHRQPPLAAGKIIGGEFHGRFGIGIALDAAIHARVQLGDLAWHAAVHGRREISGDELDRGCGALTEIATEIAAPILERRRLAPTHGAGRIDHLDQHIAADRLRQPGPLVLTPGRQCNVMKLDRGNRLVGHAHTVDSRSADRIGSKCRLQTDGEAKPPRSFARGARRGDGLPASARPGSVRRCDAVRHGRIELIGIRQQEIW